MVDPNRKINRLTDKDIEFLEECEEEFGNRYSEDDAEFMDHCAKSVLEPPIVESWNFGGGGAGHGSHGGSGQRNHYSGGNRGNRGWNRRGGGYREYPRSNRNGQEMYNYNRRARGNDAGHRRKDYGGGEHSRRNNEQPRPPMNIRRDYGNFVAASGSD